MAIRTEPFYVSENDMIAGAKVGRYQVVVYWYRGVKDSIVYTLLLNGEKVRCWSRADERTFPKQAATIGSELVNQFAKQQGITLR